jgi:hypothetical protein
MLLRLAAQRADKLGRHVHGREGRAQRGTRQQHAARPAARRRRHVEGGEAA